MTHLMIRLNGIYKDIGEIEFKSGQNLFWHQLSMEAPPQIPFGSSIEITLCFEERDLTNGKNGIIWASYDLRQAEIIRDALLSQNLSVNLRTERIGKYVLHLLVIPDEVDIDAAINFVWKDRSGLRLKPDWHYKADQGNESFNKWINNL
ncbi:hypothetical protein BMS3Abin04_01886 [bacterium BMS3Abin04]|nr:hypothetical protein BMS3Abin04_01886 [bacterium BMS3Abin04]